MPPESDETDTDDTPWRDRDRLDMLYNESGLTLEEIGEELGCTKKTVARWMDKHDIDRRRPSGRPPELEIDESELREQYAEERKTVAECADHFDCSETTIRRRLEQYDIPIRGRRGSLDDDDVSRLKRLYVLRGMSVSDVADELGVERQTVWSHLPPELTDGEELDDAAGA